MSTGVRAWTLSVLALGLLVIMLGSAVPRASAHPLSTSAVLLDLEAQQVAATVELPLDQLSVARDRSLTATTVLGADTLAELRGYVGSHLSASDASGRAWVTSVTGGRVAKVDGVDNLILDAVLRPGSGAVGDFVLHDDVIIDLLTSHHIFVSARYGHTGSYTAITMLSWQRTSVPIASVAASASSSPAVPSGPAFAAAVQLGIHHIATGSDHLIFLIMLLLPAPLLAGRRWLPRADRGVRGVARTTGRVVHVVTAFAVGHSCTLVLSALGWIHLPSRVVEGGIAVSVLVSAVHAIRPLLRRGEAVIAGAFGLLHGLAFASILTGLDLGRTDLVTTLLGFNVGIELTQLLVVALVMPSLIVLNRTRLYPAFRTAAAAIGAVLAAGWLLARLGLIAANPAEPIGQAVTDHPLVLAGLLAAVALSAFALGRVGHAPAVSSPAREHIDSKPTWSAGLHHSLDEQDEAHDHRPRRRGRVRQPPRSALFRRGAA